MSYNRPPPQAPPGYPPQGHSPHPPQPAFGGPPPAGPPPGGHYPPSQPFNHGPGGPPPGPYGGHPQGPPHQGYAQHGAYPPPPGPPGPGPYGHPPPGPGPHGGPPPMHPGGYNAPPPSGPSPGYVLNQRAPGDFVPQAEALRKAMKGFGTDEAALIRILSHLDPLQMAAVKYTYERHIARDLSKDVKSETSGYFQQALLTTIDGPLIHDTDLVHTAVKGIGTTEWVLNDVLLGRSNADMEAIKHAYHRKYNRDLQKDVADDLSAETKNLFARVVSGTRHEESAPINPAVIQSDAQRIHGSTASRGTYVPEVCAIFAQSSDNELRAINQAFHQQYHMELEKHISYKFSGHMKDALIYMLRTATDPALRDAAALEDCMAGPGTKDYKLVTRIVRLHWNKPHLDQVKRAYQHHYKHDLRERVKGETSGHYQQTMLALLEG